VSVLVATSNTGALSAKLDLTVPPSLFATADEVIE